MNFNATRDEMRLIVAIAERFESVCRLYDVRRVMQRQELLMDIEACHSNGCPLQLEALLNASEADFVHDVGGITAHLDRQTGTLTDCFVPRYAVQMHSRRMGGERRELTSAPYHWPVVDERRREARRQEDRDAVIKLAGTTITPRENGVRS
jgi:hypothetical protein